MKLRKVASRLGSGILKAATSRPTYSSMGFSPLNDLGMSPVAPLSHIAAKGIHMVSSSIASNAVEGAKSKKQNKELREELRRANLDSATKQHVIEQLNTQISSLRRALEEESAKAQRNEEKIQYMQEQLDDLLETLSAAQAA